MSRATYLLMTGALLASGTVQAADRTAARAPLVFVRSAASDPIPLRFPALEPTPQLARPAAASQPQALPKLEELPPPPQTILVPAWQGSAPARVLTHREFAASFRPQPGNYEVMLLHPYTRCPVKVCFTLPPGCLKEVEVDRNELQFDYGKFEVEVRFKRSGRVEVELDD
jgi:hypothetical protein